MRIQSFMFFDSWFILGIGSLVGVARHKDAQGGLH
jgi:hypothetical protein